MFSLGAPDLTVNCQSYHPDTLLKGYQFNL